MRGYATATGVLKKVNKSKFDLFSWICGVSAGLNGWLFWGSLTICWQFLNVKIASNWFSTTCDFIGCPEQDSNLHASQHSHLKRARLPFRHLGFSEDKGKHLFSFLQIFSTFQYAFSLLFSFYFIFHLSLTAAILLSRSNLHEFLLLYSSAIIPAGCFSRNNARWLITNNQPISHTQQSWLTRFNLFSRLIFMFRSLFLSLPCSDFFTTPILYLWRFSRCAILFLHLNYILGAKHCWQLFYGSNGDL